MFLPAEITPEMGAILLVNEALKEVLEGRLVPAVEKHLNFTILTESLQKLNGCRHYSLISQRTR